jgi:archaellum component FlaG (FlaF/FlaG flagellin family)
MTKKTILMVAMIATLTGCGGSSSSDSTEAISTKSVVKSDSSFHIAKDPTVHNVERSFGDYTLKVLTDKSISDDATSNDYTLVYGLVDGKDTKALLPINANYPKGTNVIVEAYDGDNLVTKSNPTTINSNEVNFGSISTK